MTSNSIPTSGNNTSTLLQEDPPMALIEETLSTDSLELVELGTTPPALLLTPPTPGPYDHFVGPQISGTPLSTLTMDLNDISDTSTMCDDVGESSSGSLSKLYKPLPNVVSRPTRGRQGTVTSEHSEGSSSITPSALNESGPGDKEVEESSDHEAAKAWSNGARAMMELDDANVQRWKEEIDTLLVFSGIFSAVVTGFITETMRMLRPEPLAATVAILEQIAAQLRNPQDMPDPTTERFVPKRHIIQVNSLWFTSLIFSLGVAFVGILVKQWLGEYSSGPITTSRSRISVKHARARQYRHAAFERWHVHAIMTALPFFLLSALGLFCSGLALLLFTMDLEVGIVAICMISFLFAVSVITTILPTIWDACPYRSPQAFLVFVLFQVALYAYRAFFRWVSTPVSSSSNTERERELADLKPCPTRSPSSSTSERPKLCRLTRLREWAKRRGGKRTYWSWQEREEATLLSSRDSYQMALLDELDCVKMDVAVLQDVVRPCLLTLPLDEAIPCFRNILNRRAEVVVQGLPRWESDLDRETCRALVDILLDMLSRPELSFEGTRCPPVAKQLLQKHEEVLEMFHRLISSGHHRHFLGGRYERIFKILLPYIREPQYQYIIDAAATSWLIIMSLATLQDRIPPNVVNKGDVVAVAKCVFSTSDSIISLRTSALLFSMVLALSSTDGSCEDLSGVVCTIITTVEKGLRATTLGFRGQVSDEALTRILHSFHVYLSSLEALLSTYPKFLTEQARGDLEATASRLVSDYEHVHKCGYIDSNGRSTRAYLDSISRLRELEVPPPPGVRRQTLTPDVALIVQELLAPSKPPPKAGLHWPSWLKLRSLHRKTESGDELLKDVV